MTSCTVQDKEGLPSKQGAVWPLCPHIQKAFIILPIAGYLYNMVTKKIVCHCVHMQTAYIYTYQRKLLCGKRLWFGVFMDQC